MYKNSFNKISILWETFQINKILDDMALFTIRYIYGDKVIKTLGQARALKWKNMKRKSTLRILRTETLTTGKSRECYYQTYLFLNFYKKDLVPCPLNNGWTLDNGKCVPLRYSEPPLPKDLAGSLQNVFDIEMPMYEESDGDSDYSDTEDD